MRRPRTLRWAAMFAVGLAASAQAADPPTSSPGGSRMELVNRWDLNRDGKIDEAEAELARSKMRLERRRVRQQAYERGRYRPGAKPSGEPAELPQEFPKGSLLDPAPDDPLGAAAAAPISPPVKPAEGDRRPRSKDLNAGRPREEMQRGGPTTGGTRAGAPAIRPGYGAAGPKVDLNAGRLPAGLPAARGLQPSGGSAPFRTPQATGPASGRPAEAVRPMPPPPRTVITAEEIGAP